MAYVKYGWWKDVKNALYRYPKTGDGDITRAMERMSKTEEGRQANEILRLVYFGRRNTLDGAAALLGIANRTAKRRNRKAFLAIAEEKGFLKK